VLPTFFRQHFSEVLPTFFLVNIFRKCCQFFSRQHFSEVLPIFFRQHFSEVLTTIFRSVVNIFSEVLATFFECVDFVNYFPSTLFIKCCNIFLTVGQLFLSFGIFQKCYSIFKNVGFISIFKIVVTFIRNFERKSTYLLPRLGPQPPLQSTRASRGEAGEPHVRPRRSCRRASRERPGGGTRTREHDVRPAVAPAEHATAEDEAGLAGSGG
jgi:hypothetical protein